MAYAGQYNEGKFNKLEAYRQHKENRAGGKRVRQSIDLKLVYTLARSLMPIDDMAAILGISSNFFNKCVAEWPQFAEAVHGGMAQTRRELSSTQVQLALSGNATMLIWLGKQHLKQADKHEQNNKTEISITVQKAMDELRNIPRGQLLQAQALLEMPVIEHEPESASDEDAQGVAPPANGLPPLE